MRLVARIPLAIYYRLTEMRYRWKGRKTKFTDIYNRRGFGGKESLSGPGSSLAQTQVIRDELPHLLKEINARSVLDAPCGDFHWLKEVRLDIDRYIGVDIVPEIISMNQKEYGNDKREFIVSDIARYPLPSADVILCRDCFVHLSFKDIFKVLRNMIDSDSQYLLATTFTDRIENRDIVTGRWRALNLQEPPFNFPVPVKLINEGCTELSGQYADKCLGLWRIDEIEIS